MKWLFVGDASNMHNTLATELRRRGHDCVVASNGSRWMDTARDVDLSRAPGVWGSLAYVARVARLALAWRGFDVVVLCGHHFLELKPSRLRVVLNMLKRHNKCVILSALGTDIVYYRACHTPNVFRYSDYRLGDQPSPYVGSAEYHAQHQDNWLKPAMARYGAHVLNTIDGAVTALYEYHEAYRTLAPDTPLAYGGIPIDTTLYSPSPSLSTVPRQLRLFIGIQRDRTVIKGTDRLLAAARRLRDRYPDAVELDVVENVPYDEYVSRMRRCHVLLDQIYSYTPATNALLAMAQGLIAVSGAEPEYYDFIGEPTLRPIVNVDPTVEGDIDRQLESLVRNIDRLPAMAHAAREFVVKHNDVRVVADRWLAFVNS